MQRPRGIKPIIPRKTIIDTKYSYNQFLKKGYKVLPDVKINLSNQKYVKDPEFFGGGRQPRPKTLRLFKTLKYALKLDFSEPQMFIQEFSWEKRLQFVKRMSNCRIVLIHDLKSVLRQWTKCMKRAKTLQYRLEYGPVYASRSDTTDYSSRNSTYAQHMRYLSCPKSLTVQVPEWFNVPHQEKWEIEHFPVTLERLSIKDFYDEHTLPSSLTHLKKLKHFEATIGQKCTYPFFVSVLNLLLPLSSHLQSLSLSFPFSSIPTCVKSLKNLNKLKLDIPYCYQLGDLSEFQKNLELFQDFPLEHLSLKLFMTPNELLAPVSNLLKKTGNLKSLRLHIYISKVFTNFDLVQELFKQIDNLSLLTRLSVKIKIMPRVVAQRLPELPTIFTKIFTKPIPLETFKIKLFPFEISNQGFLRLLKSLEPRASTLTKLKINIGVYTPDKKEIPTVFKFIKSLKNIRSLKLGSVMTNSKQFLTELTNAICSLLYLTVLKLGEIKGTAKRPAFIESMERILQKKGLTKFDCQVGDSFRKILERVEPNNNCIDQVKIEKRNPSICHFPKHPYIFTVKKTDRWIE